MRRRIIWLGLCVLMVISLLPISSTLAAPAYDVIRVRLSIGTVTSFPFFIDGNYSVEQDSSVQLDRQLYTVKAEGGSLGLYLGSTRLYSGSTITIKQHAPTGGLNNFIYLNNTAHGYNRYLGDLVFYNNGGNVQAVNHVYLEEYLYGVVPHEMSDSWPAHALRAQAIAARSYAVKYIKTSGNYDLGDTSSDQVYEGYDPSYANSIAAVNATSKQVVTYGGSVVTTYFSASNGGWTEIPLHNWSGGTDLPYFQIREDSFDVANPSSLYETVFFPTVISEAAPVTATANTSGTPNAANAIEYIKQAIVDSAQLSGLGINSTDDFQLAGVTDIEPDPTPQPQESEPDPTETAELTPQPEESEPAPTETAEVTPQPEESEPVIAETPKVTPQPEEETTPQPTPTPTEQAIAADATLNDATPPAAPQLALTVTSSTSITASWEAVPDADGYELWRGTQKFGAYTLVTDTAATGYTDTGLTTGKTYYYKVLAYVNGDPDRVYSSESVIQSAAPDSLFSLTGVTALVAHTPDTDGVYNDRLTQYSTIQCADFIKATGTFSVDVSGTPVTVSDVELDLRYLDASNGIDTYKVFNNASLRIFVVQAENRSGVDGFSISQKRYGHGIGLSQRGAQQRANSGQTYAQILDFYYPGTTLTTLDISKPTLTTRTTPSITNAAVTASDYVNVRSGPSTSYSVLGRLPDGARINVTQINASPGWHAIDYGGTTAYLSADYVNVTGAVYTITTAVNDPAFGNVTGGGAYIEGTAVNIRAIPYDGYRFVRWQESGSASAQYSLVVTENRTLTAEFAPIDAVTGLTANSAGYDRVELNWTAVEGASGYEIYRGTSRNGTYSLAGTGGAASYTDSGLKTGKAYYYKVRAYCSARTATTYGDFSTIESAVPTLDIPYVNPVSTSHTAIRASWTAVPGANGYEVWFATQKFGTYSLKYTSNSSAAGSYTRSGLVTDKVYYIKARAFRLVDGEKIYGEYSTIQSTAAGRPSMYITQVSSTSAKITWIPVSGSSGYEVWRSTQKNGTYALKYTASASASSWTNKNLTTGKAYYYKVRAYRMINGSKVYSQFSAINSIATTGTVPDIPSELEAPDINPVSTSHTAINTSWSAVPGADGYEVWYATQKYGTYSLKHTSNSGAAGDWTCTGLVTDKVYYIKVRAFQLSGGETAYGDFSAVQSTAPGRPSIYITRMSSTSAKITWMPVSGSSVYEVWRGTQKNGTYALKYTGSASSTGWTNSSLTTGKAYYYKVRAYRTVGGDKAYSQFSAVNSVIP